MFGYYVLDNVFNGYRYTYAYACALCMQPSD